MLRACSDGDLVHAARDPPRLRRPLRPLKGRPQDAPRYPVAAPLGPAGGPQDRGQQRPQRGRVVRAQGAAARDRHLRHRHPPRHVPGATGAGVRVQAGRDQRKPPHQTVPGDGEGVGARKEAPLPLLRPLRPRARRRHDERAGGVGARTAEEGRALHTAAPAGGLQACGVRAGARRGPAPLRLEGGIENQERGHTGGAVARARGDPLTAPGAHALQRPCAVQSFALPGPLQDDA
mmetsp:Transcript_36822/g.86642  ORF Transcript_36822/g.86642 Transcript_36822/m.86642 type:complete len:234 (+) Transcript_36822:1101-1802(+)